MKQLSRKLNLLLILSVGISVILSSVAITAFLSIKMERDRIEKDLISLKGLSFGIQSFMEHAATLNFQLSINGDIRDTIVNTEPQWNNRIKTYSEKYDTWIFSEKSGVPLLTSMQLRYSFVDLFLILDSRGNQVGRSFGEIQPADGQWWNHNKAKGADYRPFFSPSYYSSTNYKPVASIFHPVFDDSEFIGIMGSNINFQWLQELVNSHLTSPGTYAVVTDMNGVIIAHPDIDKVQSMHNLITMTRSVFSEEVKSHIKSSLLLEEDDTEIPCPVEVSQAVSSAINGETGYLKNITIDGERSNFYYTPVLLPLSGNRGENYSVLLIHNSSDIQNAELIVAFAVALFISLLLSILFPIVRRFFKKLFLDPFDTLVSSIGKIDFQTYNAIQLDSDDEFGQLAGVFNELNKKLISTRGELLDKLETLRESEAGYKSFAEVGLAFSSQKNVFDLLELILQKAMELTHADGGTLYLCDKENTHLEFKIMHTESMNFHVGGKSNDPVTLPAVPLYVDGKPNYTNVSSYTALTGKIVNIPDVYSAEGFNFKGTRIYDQLNGYRSESMLVLPMKNLDNKLIGVIQLINSKKPDSDVVVPFSSANESLSTSLAAQAATALTNTLLNQELVSLLYAFIKSIATAIDEKSPFTGGHIKRVVSLVTMVSEEINKAQSGCFADTFFSVDELEELRLAAWMHDIGKITTPDGLMDKKTKLQGYVDQMDLVDVRYEMIVNLLENNGGNEIDGRKEEILDDLEFLHNCNKSVEYLSDDSVVRLNKISKRNYILNGVKMSFLTDNELTNLLIRKGNLNSEERKQIEHHAEVTKRILAELPFPENLSHVADYASMHHEKLDGSGYPLGLTGEDIPLQARIIAVSDIFEALTAKDRPYRKPMELSDVLKIMNCMVRDNQIDGDIVQFMIDRGVVEKYAEAELNL